MLDANEFTDEIWAVLSHGAAGVGPCSVIEIGEKFQGLNLWREERQTKVTFHRP
jgi:hypothetical protein